MNTNSVALWVILQNNADWDYFKTLTLREILKIRNPLLVEHCAFWGVKHLFQSVGCVRTQTSVSHSSTESEIISLDAGWRLDGIPALETWYLFQFLETQLRTIKEWRDPLFAQMSATNVKSLEA